MHNNIPKFAIIWFECKLNLSRINITMDSSTSQTLAMADDATKIDDKYTLYSIIIL
jgi:hypothetical protein